MDEDLKNSLWNAVSKFFFTTDPYYIKIRNKNPYSQNRFNKREQPALIYQLLWTDYLKNPLDELPFNNTAFYTFKDIFKKFDWKEVYNFIEYLAIHGLKKNKSKFNEKYNRKFIEEVNKILERECAGYRFVSKFITPITSIYEKQEIEKKL